MAKYNPQTFCCHVRWMLLQEQEKYMQSLQTFLLHKRSLLQPYTSLLKS